MADDERSIEVSKRTVLGLVGGLGLGFGGSFYMGEVRPNPEIVDSRQNGDLFNSDFTVRIANEGGDGNILVRLSFYNGDVSVGSTKKSVYIQGSQVRDVNIETSVPDSADRFDASVRVDDLIGSILG